MDRSMLDSSPPDAGKHDRRPVKNAPALQGAWLQPVADATEDVTDERMARLLRTIEAEIIPRLMLAHQARHAFDLVTHSERVIPHADDVAEFARVVLVAEASESAAYVEARRMEGMTLETVYMDLLAPAARRLGALWETDQCDFTQVTLGLWRIQQLMYDLSPTFQREAATSRSASRALLVAMPGSQHTLGLFMVAEFFQRAGWVVCSEPGASARDIVAAAASEWFDVVGFSVGSETHVEALQSLVAAVRVGSSNPNLCVMVGGPLVSSEPDCVARVGADAVAADANQAVAFAEQWVGRAARQARAQ